MKFSVIIPTYQRVEFLEMAIKSVMNQTYKNYEIIVVNDEPEDIATIDSLLMGTEKVKVIHQDCTKGGNAARNLGIEHSTGQLIAFLDDDDAWLPEKLSSHLAMHLQYPDAGLVYSNCIYVHNNPLIADEATSSAVPEDIVEAMAEAKFCPTTSSIVTIRKGIIPDTGLFDENMVSFQDWDYWFRIAHSYTFVHIPKVLVLFRQHLGDRVSQNEAKRLKGISQICTKWAHEINVSEFKKTMTRIIFYQVCLNALLAGDKSAFFKKSFRLLELNILSPTSVTNFINLWLHLLIKKRKRRLQFKVF